ncbi:S8 family serine peptidase [Egicoccus sp. AB-alg6-2]|uniref:S8 family serine peptidase n=1 Tax=Egicoccus sp. AB-alg6-2 TaxID=3242692 RepID=UPI00359D5EC6
MTGRLRASTAMVGIASLSLLGFVPAPSLLEPTPLLSPTTPIGDELLGHVELDLAAPDLGLGAGHGAYIVRLEGTPAAVAAAQAGDGFDLAAHRAWLRAQQDAVLGDLATQDLDVRLLTLPVGDAAGVTSTREARMTYVLNGLGVAATPAAAAALAAHPAVRVVDPVTQVTSLMDESVAHTRAPEVWELGATGAGQSVAVLDTGIDWTHPMFGGDPTYPGDTHPKVKHYETWTAGHSDAHGHGTHVAGTAAGSAAYGDTPLGLARYDGPAKDADVWAYKVLSDAGTGLNLSVVLGIESAAERGPDVMNLSLGSENGDPDSPESEALNNAAAAGIVSAVAAGNSGPGYSTIGSPGSAHDVVTVGASTDPGDRAYLASVPDAGLLDIEMVPMAGSVIPDADQTTPFVDCGLALTPADCGAAAAGRIALIERGIAPFSTKGASAEAAGAIAAVIYNEEPGNFAGSLTGVTPGIPVVAISQEDGHALRELFGADGVSTADLRLAWSEPRSIVGQVTGFSSRGPNDDFVIKPDVVAPGNDITSSVPRAGQLASPDGYGQAGGTSMAAPHVAGILAQLTELHPDWTPPMLKTALMNTAVQLVDPATDAPYSVHDQGAGMVDAFAAATTPALLGETYRDHPAHPDGTLARGSINFGVVEVGARTVVEKQLLVQDVSGQGGRWQLRFEPGDGNDRGGEGRALPDRGWRLQLDRQVRVPANGRATANLRITLDGSRLAEGDYEGHVVATNGDRTLRAPLALRVRHAADAGAAGETLWFRGNTEDGCTGEGRLDVQACDGPFLRHDDTFSGSEAATWTALGGSGIVDGTAARNIHDPNWTWFLDGEQVTLDGTLTARWWAMCSACGDLGSAGWIVRLYADGVLAVTETVEATPTFAAEVALLEASVTLPQAVTASDQITLQIEPQYLDTQTVAVIHYDSQHGCGSDDGPCDSHVVLPVRR